jgi:hypothetical protein
MKIARAVAIAALAASNAGCGQVELEQCKGRLEAAEQSHEAELRKAKAATSAIEGSLEAERVARKKAELELQLAKMNGGCHPEIVERPRPSQCELDARKKADLIYELDRRLCDSASPPKPSGPCNCKPTDPLCDCP